MNYNIRIDLSKVDEAFVFAGRNGARYLDIVVLESKPSNFGDNRDENTHMAIQSLPKQERDSGNKGPILGNMKPFGGQAKTTSPKPTPKSKATAADMPPEVDDVPF
jgi:hypothetical protein